MKISMLATLATLALAMPAVAQEAGDPAKGEKEFNKCKACHMVQAPDGTDIIKGGKTGPNLYGIVGSRPAAEEGFKYGDGILELAEMKPDMVWNEELLIAYMTDPGTFLKEQTGDSAAKTKMTFKLNKNQADIYAFLAQHSPDAGDEAEAGEEAGDDAADDAAETPATSG